MFYGFGGDLHAQVFPLATDKADDDEVTDGNEASGNIQQDELQVGFSRVNATCDLRCRGPCSVALTKTKSSIYDRVKSCQTSIRDGRQEGIDASEPKLRYSQV